MSNFILLKPVPGDNCGQILALSAVRGIASGADEPDCPEGCSSLISITGTTTLMAVTETVEEMVELIKRAGGRVGAADEEREDAR